ncbi:MAG: AtpZ/AtpI family protein [Sandaracinaceae bacterium]|nr:AtpZ/AtpI family protein [Sandaracinaceae bacterium]
MSVRGDLKRKAKRMADARDRRGSLLAGLAMVGSVGWMIVLPAAAGALGGHWIDRRLGTGFSFALGMMILGLAAGGYAVWRFLIRERSS